jgi:hypothetical protein
MKAIAVAARALSARAPIRRIPAMPIRQQSAACRSFRRVLAVSTSRPLLAGLLFCGVSATANAQALDYYVATTAGSGNGTGSATAQYNYETLGGGVFTARGPYGSQFLTGGCGSGSGCTVSASGTVSTNPLLTSSYDQTSVSANGNGFSASASANASLATGTIGAAATGLGQLYGDIGGVGQAASYLQDNLTFSVRGATSSTVTDVTVHFNLDGTLSAVPPAGDANVRAIDAFGNGATDTTVYNTYSTSYATAVTNFDQSGWVSYTLSDADPNDISFTGVYALQGADPTVGIALYLAASCGLGATCDYADTNGVTLTLPTGVTYTSQSHRFLTASAVPEPAAWAMLLPALGILGFALRCRPNRTA